MLRSIGLLGLAFAAWAGDGFAQTYLVLPLLGDRVTIVTAERQSGRVDSSRYEVVPQTVPTFDNHVLRAVQGTFQRARPDTAIIMLRATDPKLFALRDAWLDSDDVNVRALWLFIARQSAASAASHLLLITPYRSEPQMKVGGGEYRGTGKVAGLGFYLDGVTRLRRSDTDETATGFLGVFANFQLILINLQSETIEARERITVGQTFAAARAVDKSPWEALSPARKDAVLAHLITEEIENVLPGMLKAR